MSGTVQIENKERVAKTWYSIAHGHATSALRLFDEISTRLQCTLKCAHALNMYAKDIFNHQTVPILVWQLEHVLVHLDHFGWHSVEYARLPISPPRNMFAMHIGQSILVRISPSKMWSPCHVACLRAFHVFTNLDMCVCLALDTARNIVTPPYSYTTVRKYIVIANINVASTATDDVVLFNLIGKKGEEKIASVKFICISECDFSCKKRVKILKMFPINWWCHRNSHSNWNQTICDSCDQWLVKLIYPQRQFSV